MRSALVSVVVGLSMLTTACGAAVPGDEGSAAAPGVTGGAAGAAGATDALPRRGGADRPERAASPSVTERAGTSLVGAWTLVLGGARAHLVLGVTGQGTLELGGVSSHVSLVEKGPSGELFQAGDGATARYLRLARSASVVTGRATAPGAVSPPALVDLVDHVTGWSLDDLGEAPERAYLVSWAERTAVLRLDRRDGLRGTWKTVEGPEGEEDELDLDVLTWSGDALTFTLPSMSTTCAMATSAEAISGTCGDAPATGERREVLGYGLGGRDATERAAWAASTREALRALLLFDARLVGTPTASVGPLLAPVADAPVFRRDDDPAAHPRAYVRGDVELTGAFVDRWSTTPMLRTVHGVLATPTTGAGPRGAVIALNGHAGAARRLFEPSDLWWWGDGFARRGLVVLAVDVSHRPLDERADLYDDYTEGDDPDAANGPHPSTHRPGVDADWEEDGDRTADVETALAWLTAQPDVDPSSITVVGLSMGAEVTTWASALSPGVSGVVASGFSPDLEALDGHGNHPCWKWRHAEVREYVGVSDLHALVAPRPLVVETGRFDWTFSWRETPFSADMQVLRRSRRAYVDAPDALAHFLHDGGHEMRFGELNPASLLAQQGLRVPTLTAPPGAWQTDGTTTVLAPSLSAWWAAR